MSDPISTKSIPGFESAQANYSALTKSMQGLASEMQKMSKESIDSTTQMMEKLRGAKSMEDVVSIQTGFMQESFSKYAEFTRRFGELMVSIPMEMAKNNRTALQQGTDAMTRAGEQTMDHVNQATQGG